MRHGSESLRSRGAIGEAAAAEYLQNNGYTIQGYNYYYNHGEIDIIAREGETLVFVEVKLRSSNRFGEPEESVTPRKQELLRRTAEGYVLENNIVNVSCRFDVVSVLLNSGKAECRILKDCF